MAKIFPFNFKLPTMEYTIKTKKSGSPYPLNGVTLAIPVTLGSFVVAIPDEDEC